MKYNLAFVFSVYINLAGLLMPCTVHSAELYMETFDIDAAGWTTRDGEMTVTHDNVNDWLVGSFAASFLPQSDAFQIATGVNFLGDFTSGSTNHPLTKLSFDLQAFNVLPSDLFVRLIDGANTFSYQFAALPVSLLGGWVTFTVDLAWTYGWSGLSEAAFNTALSSVDMIEIQISRSGVGAQSFYLDNVQTLNDEINAGGSVIPEPSVISLLLSAIAVLAMDRRRRNTRQSSNPCRM
jgi:hypothetical protein